MSRDRGRVRWALTAAMLAWSAVLVAPGSAAADKVVLGGGAGVIVDGESRCTLTAIGKDRNDVLVGFTSAHCGGPGAVVASEASPGAGTLGVMVAGNDALDYAVIEFDPAKVTPVNNYDGFLINGLGPDPVTGQIACKQGRSTGNSCGVTWGPGPKPGTTVNQVCGGPGDSGAPVTIDNRLVGMLHGGASQLLPGCVTKYIPLHTPAVTVSISAVLADLAERGRTGAGFVPI